MIVHRIRNSLAAIVVVGWLTGLPLHAEDYALTTFAGASAVTSGADGTPGSFNNPYGVAMDAAKNVYVADTNNNTIRKITPSGVVSTIAGQAGQAGSADGTGSAARFNFPVALALDSAGNIYVADGKNFTIRRVTPAGAVTTWAGASFQVGTTNGPGDSARFFLPCGIAVDSAGNVYVADAGNSLIRKITPDRVVSTLAGSAQLPGFADGIGAAARFAVPFGLSVDAGGNVYVADSDNHAIRRITPNGTVTTVGGITGLSGSLDGPIASARLHQPRGVALDAAGNIFVVDYGSSTIRHISVAGVVSTIAGAPGVVGELNSVGPTSRLHEPTGIVADGTTIYIADTTNNIIRRGLPASIAPLPVIALQPFDQEVSVGQSVTFSVSATGTNLTYQWLRNNLAISGATNAAYTIAAPQLDDSASYRVHITGTGGSIDSNQGVLTVTPVGSGPIVIAARPLSQNVVAGQRATLSVTASGPGLTYQWFKDGATIAGATSSAYTIASAQAGDAATYSVRISSGSSTETATANLTVGGVAGTGISITTQPTSQSVNSGQPVTFRVVAGASSPIVYQWVKNGAEISGATSATYTIGAAQAADAGTYSVRVSSAGANVLSSAATLTVVALGPTSWLANLSIFTAIATPGDSFKMGYVVGGGDPNATKPILIRAAGPSLAQIPGVSNVLADPRMELFRGSSASGTNDNWGGTATLMNAFSAVAAFPYINGTSLDAAALANIAPGENSVQVSATGNGTGAVIAELYDSTPGASRTASTPRLINVSVLKHIGDVLTMGFNVSGTSPLTVLVRAVGPTLAALDSYYAGIVVADPQLTLYVEGGAAIVSNNNWGGTAELTTAFNQTAAFRLPTNSLDAAIVRTLQPGSYTVEVTGVNNTTGFAIVEVYEVR